jgi:basic membrane lipoprotein Med (substrate-binding protein (PBP1-ABC) superfamily)
MGMRLPLVLVLVLVIVLLASGCVKRSETAPLGPSRSIGVAFESSPRDAFGDEVYSALESETRARGGRISALGDSAEPRRPSSGLDLVLVSSRLEGRDDEQVLEVLAAGGRDLVIAAGPRFVPAVERVASKYPGQRFAVLGAKADGRTVSPNVSYIRFDDSQAVFLAGAAAALMAEDGPKDKIGFMGAAGSREGAALEAAFRAGAATVAPERRKAAGILARYCDPVRESEIAQAARAELAKKGASIAFEAGFGPEPRLVRGSELLATTRRRGGAAASILLEELFSRGSLAPGYRKMGLAEGAVDIKIDALGAKERGRLEAALSPLRDRLASGELEVPQDDAALAGYIAALPAR